MRKIAVAVCACFLSAGASAATVEVYGRVDLGLAYKNTKITGSDAVDSLSLDSGNSTGSRWGFRGKEKISDSLSVGFDLENSLSADTGKLGQGGRLFGRESTLNVSGPFGTVYAGRINSPIADAGSIGWYGADVSPFGTGWGDILGHNAVMCMAYRFDNSLAWDAPDLGGWRATVMYGMGSEGKENEANTDRYLVVAAGYEGDGLMFGALVDFLNKDSSDLELGAGQDFDDAWTINLGGNYTIDRLTLFLAAQYFNGVSDVGDRLDSADIGDRYTSLDGWALNLGASIDLGSIGTLMLSAGYADADLKEYGKDQGTTKIYSALVGYQYPFSKTANYYFGVGYTESEFKFDGVAGKINDHELEVMTGVVVRF